MYINAVIYISVTKIIKAYHMHNCITDKIVYANISQQQLYTGRIRNAQRATLMPSLKFTICASVYVS